MEIPCARLWVKIFLLNSSSKVNFSCLTQQPKICTKKKFVFNLTPMNRSSKDQHDGPAITLIVIMGIYNSPKNNFLGHLWH